MAQPASSDGSRKHDLFVQLQEAPVSRSQRVAQLWQATWGLPQTLVGLVMYLAPGRTCKRGHFRSAFVREWKQDAGLSLGMFIFLPRGCQRPLLVHEYGHTVQSLMLGPLYLPVVVVPSLLWAGIPALRRLRARKQYSYYRFYTERWANRLTSRVTGERPVGWFDKR